MVDTNNRGALNRDELRNLLCLIALIQQNRPLNLDQLRSTGGPCPVFHIIARACRVARSPADRCRPLLSVSTEVPVPRFPGLDGTPETAAASAPAAQPARGAGPGRRGCCRGAGGQLLLLLLLLGGLSRALLAAWGAEVRAGGGVPARNHSRRLVTGPVDPEVAAVALRPLKRLAVVPHAATDEAVLLVAVQAGAHGAVYAGVGGWGGHACSMARGRRQRLVTAGAHGGATAAAPGWSVDVSGGVALPDGAALISRTEQRAEGGDGRQADAPARRRRRSRSRPQPAAAPAWLPRPVGRWAAGVGVSRSAQSL